MTSEIVLMNKDCAVLAADSAATLNGPNRKIYEANKIFSLSREHPIGVMTYQSMAVSNVPVETLFKEYRKRNVDEPWKKP